jgi:hypothetical protein
VREIALLWALWWVISKSLRHASPQFLLNIMDKQNVAAHILAQASEPHRCNISFSVVPECIRKYSVLMLFDQ